jgi:hypothetical protein
MHTIKLMLDAILFEWRSRRGFMNLLSLFRIAGALAVYFRFQYFATENWGAIYPVWLGYFFYSWGLLILVLFHNRDQPFGTATHYIYYILVIVFDVFAISYFLDATFLPPVEDTNSELYLFYLLPLITTAFYIRRADAALGISVAIVLIYFITLRGMSPDKPYLFEVWAARAIVLLLATWFVRVLVKFHHLHEERVTSPTGVRNQLEELLHELRQSIAYDTISVQILYRTHLQIVCCLGFDNPKDIYQIEFPSDDKKYPNHLVISSKLCIVANPKEYPSFNESQYFADHIATWMGVPLISPDTGECFGMISIDSKTPQAYSEWDKWKARWFTAKVSSFLVAAGLGPAALTQSTKRENLLELLRQWAQLLPRKSSDWEDDNQAANFLANFGKDLFHVEDCSIYFLRHRLDELDDKIRVLHLVASSTIPPEIFSKNESLVTGHHGDGLTGLAVHRNKTLNLGANQIKRSPYRGKFTDHLKYMFSKSSRQIMIVPLRDARGRAKGAIKIENRMGRTSAQPFSPVEEHTFEIFAAMVSLMLENTRQRNFIERQMQSVHSLRGIMPHGIAPLEELLQGTNHQKRISRASYQKKLEEALNPFVYSKSILDSILAESGETLLLENEGLIPALYHLIDSLKTMPALKPSCERIAFQLEDARDYLPFRVRVAFYNVAREAILNLVRHSGIDMQENGMGLVKFYVDDTTYHLVIQDNGKGFNLSEKVSHRHSFGLNDMLEFQKNVIKKLCRKADLSLNSEPEKGTLIHLWATL